jgi:hypothetical protein
MRGWLGIGPLWAILVSSIHFGLQHGQLAQLISLITIGIFLGVVRWRSGSIVPALVMHSVFNLISFLLLLPKTEPAWLTNTNIVLAGLVALPALVLCFIYLYRHTWVESRPAVLVVEDRGKILLAISSVLVLGMFGLFGLLDIASRLLPSDLFTP